VLIPETPVPAAVFSPFTPDFDDPAVVPKIPSPDVLIPLTPVPELAVLCIPSPVLLLDA
jgi:hypothetical protein